MADSAGSSGRMPLVVLVSVCAVMLAPYLNKPVHMDDPVYVWTAQRIIQHPLDYYGFSLNWYGYAMPVHEFNQNPPLSSYYLAPFGALFGWNEWILHFAMAIAAVGAVLGVWALARRFCAHPIYAALVAFVTPAFFVSATTLMADIPMLCAYVWAIETWCRGLEKGRAPWFLLAALLMAVSALTKYFGLSLLPLIAVYTLAVNRSNFRHLLWLLLPSAAVLIFAAWNLHLYGHTLVLDAMGYRGNLSDYPSSGLYPRFVVTLAFLGACMAPLLFLSPLLWSWRWNLAWLAIGGLCAASVWALQDAEALRRTPGASLPWWHLTQIALWTTVGLSGLALAVRDIAARRDPASLLLFLWLAGVFVFAWLFNWTVSARTLLPMAPAVGILVARRLDDLVDLHLPAGPRPRYGLFAAAAALTLAVAAADYGHAATSRRAATEILNRNVPGTVRFTGHWGFQYYMQNGGAIPIDTGRAFGEQGDLVVFAHDNTNPLPPSEEAVRSGELVGYPLPPGLTTMHSGAGAGYYSDVWGPVPFVFGPRQSLQYTLWAIDPGSK